MYCWNSCWGHHLQWKQCTIFGERIIQKYSAITYILIFIKVDPYLKLGNSMGIQVSTWMKLDQPNSVVYAVVYTNPFFYRHVSVANELKKANLGDILVAMVVKGRVSHFWGHHLSYHLYMSFMGHIWWARVSRPMVLSCITWPSWCEWSFLLVIFSFGPLLVGDVFWTHSPC